MRTISPDDLWLITLPLNELLEWGELCGAVFEGLWFRGRRITCTRNEHGPDTKHRDHDSGIAWLVVLVELHGDAVLLDDYHRVVTERVQEHVIEMTALDRV